jgi:hypothetical protein
VIAVAARGAERDWELSLFVHVLGAMLLVGFLLGVAFALLFAWRRGEGGEHLALTRFAFRTLLVAALPSWLLMRIGAQWVESDSPFDDEAGWIGIGYLTADGGLLVLIATTVLAGLAVRKLRGDGAQSVMGRIAAVLTWVLVIAYLVAIFAMTTKPD